MQVEEAARGLASRKYLLSVTQSVKAEAAKLLNSKPGKLDKVRLERDQEHENTNSNSFAGRGSGESQGHDGLGEQP